MKSFLAISLIICLTLSLKLTSHQQNKTDQPDGALIVGGYSEVDAKSLDEDSKKALKTLYANHSELKDALLVKV